MGFIKQAANTEKLYEKGSNYELGQSIGMRGGMTGTNDDMSASNAVRQYKGVVQKCVRDIATGVAKHKLRVYKLDAKGNKIDVKEDHEFVKLVRKPNSESSEYDLAESTESYREILGEYLIAFNMTTSRNKPVEAFALRPDFMTVVPDSKGNIIAYEFNRADGKLIKFTPEEVMFDKTFNPFSNYRGLGTVQSAIRNIAIEDSASQYTKSFFDNSATPAGIVAVKGSQEGYTFGDSAHKKLKAKWLDEFKGSENAGKLAFLREAEVSYQQIGLGLDKVDMKVLRSMTKEDIYEAFGIPRIFAGDYGNMNYASAVIAKQIFAEMAILPRLIKRQQMWQKVADKFWPGEKLLVEYVNVVPEDDTRKLEVAKNGSTIGLTENEKRELVGYEPIPQGETVWRPMNLVEYNTKGVTKTVSFKKEAPIDEKAIVKAQKDNEAVRKESYRSGHEELQKQYEKIMLTTLRDYLKDQNEEVKSNLAPKKGLKDVMFDSKVEDAKMVGELTPIVTQLYVESGKLVVNFLGESDDFSPINTDVSDYIKEQIQKLAGDFNEQTKDQLLASLTEGYTSGDSVASIAKRIDKVYKEAGASGYAGKSGYRAERVARTEVIRANGRATQESYRQLGITQKQWMVNPGACDLCLPFDGRIVGTTQNFLQKGEEYLDASGVERSNTYEDVAHSPLHPQCRCTIIPVRV